MRDERWEVEDKRHEEDARLLKRFKNAFFAL
jgi:hypothetical protein